MAKSNTVIMTHSGFPDRDPAKVSRQAFEKIWKKKGWSEVKSEVKGDSEKPKNSSATPPSTSSSTPQTSGGSK